MAAVSDPTTTWPNKFVTLGRAQRPSPTQRICFDERQHTSQTGSHNRRFVTPGGIGTHGMHRRHKRLTCHSESDIITMSKRYAFLCGRTQRSAPTRRICSRPARAENRYLASVAATADTNAEERSATGQRQGEGARLGGDVGTGVGNLDVASGPSRHV